MRSQLDDPKAAPGLALAWPRVAAFVSAIDASLDRWLADAHRIGLTEYRALTLLSQAPDRELRVNELARRLALNPSSVTRVVTRLEARGLARRDLCQDDARGVYAVLDEAGDALLREVREPYEARIAELLSRPEAHLPQIDPALVRAAFAEVAALVEA